MGYVGNQSGSGYSSLPTKQDLTGATGTSLTLTHAVFSNEGIDLYINNVRQEPGTAYTVVGTAVTLTGTVVSTDDIYVVYNSLALQTTVPPDGSVTMAKLASTGTLPALDGSALTGISSDVVDDTTPQLGGNLDLNSNNITGTGFIDISGKVATDTIEHSTAGSVATNYLVLASAKAWVYYDNLSSNVTRGSFSISSVTDNGVGDATVTISSAMTDAFSCIAGLTGHSTSDPSTRFMSGCIPSTTTVRLESIKTDSNNIDQNCNHMCIIGDLA